MLAWGSDYEELTMAVDRCVSRPYVGLPPYRESGYPLPLVAAEVQPMKSRFTFPKSAQLTLRTGQTFRLLRSHSAHLNKDRLVRTSTHRQCAESPCHLFISPQAQALLCQPRQYPLMIFFSRAVTVCAVRCPSRRPSSGKTPRQSGRIAMQRARPLLANTANPHSFFARLVQLLLQKVKYTDMQLPFAQPQRTL